MSLLHSFQQRLETVPAPMRRPATIVWTLAQDFLRCDLLKQASAMAYVSLLSLIPSLVAIFCVLSLFAPLVAENDFNLVEQLRSFILSNLASSSGEAVVNYLDSMLADLSLKKIGWSSFASVLITLVLLLRQIEEALNRIWLINKGRNLFTRFMYFWTFLTLGVVVIATILGVTSGFDIRRVLHLQAQVSADRGPLGSVAGLTGGFLFFFFLYKIVPYCQVRARYAAAGAIASAAMLSVASFVYGAYIINSQNYLTLYGALAQLPLFLMWLYICWVVILLGALLSWRLQEGFPQATSDETLDSAQMPLELLRNAQLQTAMPLIALVTIHQRFQQGSGRGLTAQDLAHSLHVPASWVRDALSALEELGYVVAASSRSDDDGATVTQPYFPSIPADSVRIGKLLTDLARPSDDWMVRCQHDCGTDLSQTLQALRRSATDTPEASLAEVLARV